jgi:hypothetical protein
MQDALDIQMSHVKKKKLTEACVWELIPVSLAAKRGKELRNRLQTEQTHVLLSPVYVSIVSQNRWR